MSKESLLVDLKVGESVSIENGRIVVTLREKSGQRAKLHFVADKDISIEPVRARAALIAKNGVRLATA